ncbi:MAG: 4-hydroxy-3-methylbut-2-enyl diphosphate reductase [Candidatus Moranbacteria bacterium]|nr:4-hydroxy-3-methylbut-2-enyl diphosphate reductase [Candidatus Moranbacteria bacterium]
MKITLSQFAGFCDGVRRAFEIVQNIDSEKIKKPVFVLGSLVHNQDVVNKIEEKGIAKIDMQTFLDSKAGEIGTLIITAHGAGPKIYEIAKVKGIEIIDTTCPRVIKVQRLAQVYFNRGYTIILVGDRDHKEVKSIFEWGGEKALLVSNQEELRNLDLSGLEKVVVLTQTTQSKDFVKEVVEFLKAKYPNAESLDTICLATDQRQDEIKNLARDNDGVVVIGSPDSANSNRLFEIATSVNPKTIFIERAEDLTDEWFSGLEKVAVTAGASTPDWIIEGVLARIEKL